MKLSQCIERFVGIQFLNFCLAIKSISIISTVVFFLVQSSGVTAMKAQIPAEKNRPTTVPMEYVVTPSGYFHPSCVKQLGKGEALRPDEHAIRHSDGRLDSMPICNYPHYNVRGETVTNSRQRANSIQQGIVPYISHAWLEDYGVETSTSYGNLAANWIVPPAPTSNDGQILYFFPGMEDYNYTETIIQPVLAWNNDSSNPYAPLNVWSIASWNCCYSGTAYESTPITVSSGDTILGEMQSTCSAGTLTCGSWNITTTDVTSGQSTTLPQSSSLGQTFNWAFPGVLEVYSISQCSDYPPNGAINFYNVALYDDSFNRVSNPVWNFNDAGSASFSSLTPQCNYSGQETAQQVTLAYGLPPVGIINTVAGSSNYGYTGDGGLATSAELYNPADVVLDSAGNMYISDEMNWVVRKVTASTGIITTIAGNGTYGYSGDGGPATSAQLAAPAGLALDASGNLYIGDGATVVRKVDISTGIISTVAGNGTSGYSGDGGPATNAQLNAPYTIALDSAGNIYIADFMNKVVRKVTVSTGIITTVAGNGTWGYSGDGGPATSAELSPVLGVAVDSAGNIYIADTINSVIRKVTASTGIISTVAGQVYSLGYVGDGGPATSAEMYEPEGISVDGAGNIYIADTYNHAIRKVLVSAGTIETVAGNGTGGFSGDGGAATNAQLQYPWHAVVDGAGNLYIADSYNNRIRKVSY